MLSHCAEVKFALRVDHQPDRLESFPKSINASSCGFATGSARNRMASISWKIAVFAPIPRASDSTATAVNIGFRRSWRSPNLRSLIIASILLVLILRKTALVTTVCKKNVSRPWLNLEGAPLQAHLEVVRSNTLPTWQATTLWCAAGFIQLGSVAQPRSRASQGMTRGTCSRPHVR